jgi:glycosyltransferase involved in cell wall biosynthesis|tara:strand:+ start:54 stop:731 length:678 start_codon:yes stop_codon:yes gene_type:complete
MTDKISLIIPAKNEIESLNAVLSEINNNQFIDEIIVIVDDEDDNSINIAKQFKCKIVIQKKKGYGSAIVEGFKNAKNNFGCIYNADYSFDPNYLEELINKSQTNDFIFGTRYTKQSGSEDDDIVTFTGNKIFSFITRYGLGIKLSDILFTYVLCNVQKFNSINFNSSDFRLCIELPFQVKKNNFSYSELPIFERSRFAGKKKVNVIKDGFLILIEILRSFKQLIK